MRNAPTVSNPGPDTRKLQVSTLVWPSGGVIRVPHTDHTGGYGRGASFVCHQIPKHVQGQGKVPGLASICGVVPGQLMFSHHQLRSLDWQYSNQGRNRAESLQFFTHEYHVEPSRCYIRPLKIPHCHTEPYIGICGARSLSLSLRVFNNDDIWYLVFLRHAMTRHFFFRRTSCILKPLHREGGKLSSSHEGRALFNTL